MDGICTKIGLLHLNEILTQRGRHLQGSRRQQPWTHTNLTAGGASCTKADVTTRHGLCRMSRSKARLSGSVTIVGRGQVVQASCHAQMHEKWSGQHPIRWACTLFGLLQNKWTTKIVEGNCACSTCCRACLVPAQYKSQAEGVGPMCKAQTTQRRCKAKRHVSRQGSAVPRSNQAVALERRTSGCIVWQVMQML